MTEREIYTERIRNMTDEALKKEWEHPAAEYFMEGACLRKVEHEMALRFMGKSRQQRSASEEQSHYLQKYMELPGQFWEAYSRKDWSRAKMIYEDIIRIGLFLDLPEADRARVLGSRQDPDNVIEGMIPDEAVHKVMHECVVRNRLGHECIVYRVPGEIGFYGARPVPGTKYMKEEENPAYYAEKASWK